MFLFGLTYSTHSFQRLCPVLSSFVFILAYQPSCPPHFWMPPILPRFPISYPGIQCISLTYSSSPLFLDTRLPYPCILLIIWYLFFWYSCWYIHPASPKVLFSNFATCGQFFHSSQHSLNIFLFSTLLINIWVLSFRLPPLAPFDNFSNYIHRFRP